MLIKSNRGGFLRFLQEAKQIVPSALFRKLYLPFYYINLPLWYNIVK